MCLIRFGVPWLDAWFSASLEDEQLGETFLRLSPSQRFFLTFLTCMVLDELGLLVTGATLFCLSCLSSPSVSPSSFIITYIIIIIIIIILITRVSDELGHLVAGQHKAGRGREALLDLLGPAFVGRHLRMHWKEDLQTTWDHGRQKEALDQGGQHLTSQRQSGRISGRVKSSRSGRLTKSRSRW